MVTSEEAQACGRYEKEENKKDCVGYVIKRQNSHITKNPKQIEVVEKTKKRKTVKKTLKDQKQKMTRGWIKLSGILQYLEQIPWKVGKEQRNGWSNGVITRCCWIDNCNSFRSLNFTFTKFQAMDKQTMLPDW